MAETRNRAKKRALEPILEQTTSIPAGGASTVPIHELPGDQVLLPVASRSGDHTIIRDAEGYLVLVPSPPLSPRAPGYTSRATMQIGGACHVTPSRHLATAAVRNIAQSQALGQDVVTGHSHHGNGNNNAAVPSAGYFT